MCCVMHLHCTNFLIFSRCFCSFNMGLKLFFKVGKIFQSRIVDIPSIKTCNTFWFFEVLSVANFRVSVCVWLHSRSNLVRPNFVESFHYICGFWLYIVSNGDVFFLLIIINFCLIIYWKLLVNIYVVFCCLLLK